MLRPLSAETLRMRSQFIRDVRTFFFERDYTELETPLLNVHGGVDPFLDPMQVQRASVPKSPQHGTPDSTRHLITSPEYNMKIAISVLQGSAFQIAHCFREGDRGDLHSEEFLMLEWYRVGGDEFAFMEECIQLLDFLSSRSYSQREARCHSNQNHTERASTPFSSLLEVMRESCGCGFERAELEEAIVSHRLLGIAEDPAQLRYDELFYSLFLNLVEPKLGREGPQFLYGYPPEMAAMAEIDDGIARRFELYWEGVELANGYFELRARSEQERRFQEENMVRQMMSKKVMTADPQFLGALEDGLPLMTGAALGLDRLFMLLRNEINLEATSPFL